MSEGMNGYDLRNVFSDLQALRADRDAWKESAQKQMWREELNCREVEAERDRLRTALEPWVEYFSAIEAGTVGVPREQIRTFEKILLDASRAALAPGRDGASG